MNSKVSVVISSCNKYSYLWDIQLELFKRYWPDCPYDIYMISETTPLPNMDFGNLRLINYNTNSSTTGASDWSVNLSQVLNSIDSEYIIYLQEDYVFTSKVDMEKLQSLLEFTIDNGINYVRLYTAPPGNGPQIQVNDSIAIKEILPGTEWRNSLLLAIWKKQTLLSALSQTLGITPWDFELYVNIDMDKFYCIHTEKYGSSDIIHWMGLYGSSNGFGIYPQAAEFLQREGITKADGRPIDFNIRL